MIHPPRSSQDIAALRDAAGRLVTDPRQLPNVVASFWERISCLPSGLDSADQQAVLAAVDAHSTPISPDLRPELGSLAVSAAEVARALQQAKPGTSPGWDGIPVDLLRTYSGCFVPALARLFTAIGHLRAVPTGFLKGVISVIYKGHDADLAAAGAYRPITLLCTDYRLLAKVLANRLSPGLSAAIPLEQSAFLPGRSIGANTRFLRCLPPSYASSNGVLSSPSWTSPKLTTPLTAPSSLLSWSAWVLGPISWDGRSSCWAVQWPWRPSTATSPALSLFGPASGRAVPLPRSSTSSWPTPSSAG